MGRKVTSVESVITAMKSKATSMESGEYPL